MLLNPFDDPTRFKTPAPKRGWRRSDSEGADQIVGSPLGLVDAPEEQARFLRASAELRSQSARGAGMFWQLARRKVELIGIEPTASRVRF